MPELPEVETIRLGLSKKITGLKIKNVEILTPKSFQGDSKILIDKKVLNIRRLAKVLVIDLVGNLSILIHLKMSGQLIYQDTKTRFVGGHPTPDMKNQMPNKSTRVIFEFSNSSKLYFNDQRKFGWVKIVNSEQLTADNFIKNLGPEPLEKKFTWEVLKERLQKRKNTTVKALIMDQTIISGIGNIYASEACFDAKIDPRTKVASFTDNQYKKLHQGIIKSLEDGIKHGGFSLDYAFVYGRKGESCKVCTTPIKKLQLGGRGTYYCKYCQK